MESFWTTYTAQKKLSGASAPFFCRQLLVGGGIKSGGFPPPPVCAYVQQFPLSTPGKHSPMYTVQKGKKRLRHPLARLKLPDQARSQRAFLLGKANNFCGIVPCCGTK